MPITVVIGGQYGSEGKGKVALTLARDRRASVAVRVGGPNSGHTVLGPDGTTHVFRQLPTASLLPDVLSILPAGAIIQPSVLEAEIDLLHLGADRLIIDPRAVIVTEREYQEEQEGGLIAGIGSTGTGTGSAVRARMARNGSAVFAYETATLRPWVKAAGPVMADRLRRGERVVVEGTQGFGLSVLHSHTYPFVTSRDTTASAALSEAGLSPLDVTEVALVLRAFPIRVGGHSGPLPSETSWADIRAAGCHDHDLTELTSVTRKPRRVGRFDPSIVREAIDANSPTVVVMNHVDHVDHESCMSGDTTGRTRAFVRRAEAALGRSIDLVGTGPGILHKNGRDAVMRSAS